MTRAARARWFGAGAATVALAVMVYEGGVTLAGTAPGRAPRPGPGGAHRGWAGESYGRSARIGDAGAR